MIEVNLASQTRDLEQKLLIHARRLVETYREQQRVGSQNAWRTPELLWPNFMQDD